MGLPIRTTESDVETLVNYLKTKATGSTIKEAKPIIDRALDPRKITAYEQWQIITKEGDRIKLATRGRSLSRASEESKKDIYRQILREMKAYHAALEYAYHKKLNTITNVDIAAYWHDHYNSQLGTDKEVSIKLMAVCLFNVIQAAGLGNFIVGRKGQDTRVELFPDELGQYIGETGIVTDSTSKSEEEDEATDSKTEEVVEKEEEDVTSESQPPAETPELTPQIKQEKPTKIFISHGKNMEIVEQMKTMLELADLDYEVVVEEESTAIPVPEKVFNSMRDCTAAVICVSADEHEKRDDGTYVVNQNVLIEIGAAFVLYDKRVVLVWDKNIEVPSNLQGLYRCEYSGDELSWTAGMKLMKAVRNFKKRETST